MTANQLRREKIDEWMERTKMTPEAEVYADLIGNHGWALPFWKIPDYMHGGICRWVLFGVVPGDFLCAVLRHDLMGAARQADDNNRRLLWEYANVMANAMPEQSHGPHCFATWKGVWPHEEEAPA